MTGLAHLMRHAKALSDGSHDDAHTSEWAEGAAAAKGLVLTERLREWCENVATEQASMRHIGMDTKDGGRIRPELRVTGEEVETELHRVLDWAKTVDRGVDGRARVDRLRQELALMDLEV
jgi:phage terminase large subunit-like protein